MPTCLHACLPAWLPAATGLDSIHAALDTVVRARAQARATGGGDFKSECPRSACATRNECQWALGVPFASPSPFTGNDRSVCHLPPAPSSTRAVRLSVGAPGSTARFDELTIDLVRSSTRIKDLREDDISTVTQVSPTSSTGLVAGAIAGRMGNDGQAQLVVRPVGRRALLIAAKAVALAREFLAKQHGRPLFCVPRLKRVVPDKPAAGAGDSGDGGGRGDKSFLHLDLWLGTGAGGGAATGSASSGSSK